jgi:hypothetical protein
MQPISEIDANDLNDFAFGGPFLLRTARRFDVIP